MKLDKDFLTALYESQTGQQEQSNPVVKLNQAKADEDLIEEFIEWYNKKYRKNTSLADWDIKEEEIKSYLSTDKGIILHFKLKTQDDEYDVMDKYTAKIAAYNQLFHIVLHEFPEFYDYSEIGGLESYLTNTAIEDIRDALEEYFESDANEMLSDRKTHEKTFKEIAKNYGLNPDDSDFASDYADARVSDLSNSDVIAEYIDAFGEDKFKEFIFKHPIKYVDMDKLFGAILKNDGYGPYLSFYDGSEFKLPNNINGKTWFVYRTN